MKNDALAYHTLRTVNMALVSYPIYAEIKIDWGRNGQEGETDQPLSAMKTLDVG